MYFADHPMEDVRRLADNSPHHQESILFQIDCLQKLENLPACYGKMGPLVMGIVNVTPDSFSDGGEFFGAKAAVAQAKQLLNQGADILDIGGESTRPGAETISVADEIGRVVPIIQEMSASEVVVSVDTRKAEVMQAALAAGANMINDITALEYDGKSLPTAVNSGKPVCLMHSSADPKVMQDNPQYDHALFDVIDYLRSRVELCVENGINREKIMLDPGIGFGKTLEHNLVLLKGLRFFHALGCPVLLGTSRKSFIAKVAGDIGPKERLPGSLTTVLAGLEAGIQIFRVHDVVETRQAIAIWQAIDNTPLS
ncbi:dihydropteroate synthase [Sneathiella limimaris]|uniref:dihydropteroate synthase n=1 Tax=Sneathiella limimaris TaxID=1964213 RepID=UPI0019D14BA4|nr:dihydropteroate synthase [Sneathiella limimaris]